MKRLLIGLSLVLFLGGALHAQSDEINLQKYWKLRNDFRDYFVKISDEAGGSIVARSLTPAGCIDNLNNNGTAFGMMEWGDGTLRHGHYLTLLATEYRLLKNAHQDTTAVLNELYYALMALERLDYNAGFYLGQNYNLVLPHRLNGFMLREDVPENFARDNWGGTNFNMRCTNSDYYKNNNVMKVNNPSQNYEVAQNSIRNNPSADQVQSLLVGLSMVHRLVDNVLVQPTPSDSAFYIVNKTQTIVNRMMTFLRDHNWYWIDVNGWPVNNMGGDFLFTAYPAILAAQRIVGMDFGTTNIIRRFGGFDLNLVETCKAGKGSDDDISQNQACDNLAFHDVFIWGTTGVHSVPIQAITEIDFIESQHSYNQNSLQDDSPFQTWLATSGPGSLDLTTSWSHPFWEDSFMQAVQNVLADLDDDGKLNSGLLPLPFNVIRWSKDEGRQYTRTIIFESGVMSGLWTRETAGYWGDYTDNRELELINNVMYNQTPVHSQSFYRNYLDQMSSDGPYCLTFKIGNSCAQYIASPNGWGSDYRWGSGDILGDGGRAVYSGLDYMILHNLYYLLYQNNLPEFKEVDGCLNNPVPHLDSAFVFVNPICADTSGTAEALYNINAKAHYIPHYTKDVFDTLNNDVPSGLVFDIKPQFDSYIDLKIFTTKHQTHNTMVEPGAVVNVKTRFDICTGNTLTINKSALNIAYSRTILEANSVIDCINGDIRIKSGATFELKGGSVLKLKYGSKLILEENAQLIIGNDAILEYYDGATIYTEGPHSVIQLFGNIQTKDATDFTIIPNGTGAGKIYVENSHGGFHADAPSTFTLYGKGINDSYIIVRNYGNLLVNDANITSFTINNCKVELKENTRIEMQQPFYATSTHFYAAANNNGFILTDLNSFNTCNFTNVPVIANLGVENTGVLTANHCNFTYNNKYLLVISLPLVAVSGRGYSFDHCNFNGLFNTCLRSDYLTLTSNIYASNFTNNEGSTISTSLFGVVDNSDVEIYAKESNFTRCLIGIKKQLGKLSLKCSGFTSNREVNIYAKNSCDLNMSYPNTAGRNSLTATYSGKNIQIENSNVTLSGGANYIQAVPNYTIFGSLESSCSGLCFARNYSGNQWAANIASPPANSSFQITFSNGPGMIPLLTPLANYAACYTGDDGGGLAGRAAGGKSAGIDSSFVFYSLVRADSVSMADQIATAQAKMSLYADSGVKANDLYAIRLLDELFYIGNVDRSDAYTNSLLWTAYDNMKGAVESAFKHDIITAADNTGSFEEHVGNYVHALMYLSDSVIDSTNFYQQYYLELDKAHLFRLLERPSVAYNMLYELESCGIDSLTQSIVNQWKQQTQEEMVIANIGILALDTVIVVDTSSYLNPSLVVNNFHFGAIINDPNDIQYPNCLYFDTKYLESRNEALSVYPNPASASFFVQWLGSEQASELLIVQGDGKTVLHLQWPQDNSTVKIASESWSPGMYVVHVKDAQGRVHTKKLILN